MRVRWYSVVFSSVFHGVEEIVSVLREITTPADDTRIFVLGDVGFWVKGCQQHGLGRLLLGGHSGGDFLDPGRCRDATTSGGWALAHTVVGRLKTAVRDHCAGAVLWMWRAVS